MLNQNVQCDVHREVHEIVGLAGQWWWYDVLWWCDIHYTQYIMRRPHIM